VTATSLLGMGDRARRVWVTGQWPTNCAALARSPDNSSIRARRRFASARAAASLRLSSSFHGVSAASSFRPRARRLGGEVGEEELLEHVPVLGVLPDPLLEPAGHLLT
jgi:hypothetical protein